MIQLNGVVYLVKLDGHRREWLELLGPLLRLNPLHGRITFKRLRELVGAPRLLFATLDDDIASFVAVALARSALGRPTAAVFFQPQRCFVEGSTKSSVKLWIFKILRRLPGLVILTIMPFDLAPQFILVAHGGVVDPQYWDLQNMLSYKHPVETELSRSIKYAAKDRKVLCLMGSLNSYKGFQFIAETLKAHPDLKDHFLVVAAGRVTADASDLACDFVQCGGILIDRWLDDTEILSLYSVSSLIWSCYAPEYDQASGIFGRAIQMGVPVVVRRGSFIDKFARKISSPVVSVDFGSIPDLAMKLMEFESPSFDAEQVTIANTQQTAAWRENFILTLDAALAGIAPKTVLV